MTIKGVFIRANETRTFEAGEVIFAQGDASSQMFGVVSGVIPAWRMSRMDPVFALKGAA